ncbi:MAG TPA: hypothetical protein VNN79_15070 [Actinomycetota bacterium]|nr:hypothetical protein [Actinomycetota bacterium]
MPRHDEENPAEPAEAADPGVASEVSGPAEAEDSTLAKELVQETAVSVGEVSPDVGETKADPGAGGSRFDELVAKRKSKGLTDEESEELGRLMAQRDGREWTSTQQIRSHPADTP